MMYAADFRAKARESLRGNWTIAVAVGFVACLFGAGTVFGRVNFVGWLRSIEELNAGMLGLSLQYVKMKEALQEFSEYFDSEMAVMIYFGFIGIVVLIGILIAIIHFIIGGAITLGYVEFHLNIEDQNNEAKFKKLFSQFKRLKTGIAMQVLRGVYILLWSFIPIAGYIKTFSYAMTPYILTENPGLTANQAITESRKLMDGNKWRLFCLSFSFIGWFLLCIFTGAFGIFLLRTYQEASFAAFYREIKREKYGEPEYRDTSYYEINQEENESTDEN